MGFLQLLIISIVISIILFAIYFFISLASYKHTPNIIDSTKTPFKVCTPPKTSNNVSTPPRNTSTEEHILKIIELADKGDNIASEELRKMFDKGLTSEKHNELRKACYLPKARNGDPNAEYWMGFLCGVVDGNKNGALNWLEKAANHGNPRAMCDLAFAYDPDYNENYQGYGIIPLGANSEKQKYWLTKAAETGDAAGQFDLADYYYFSGEKETAIKWYEKIINSNNNNEYYLKACIQLGSLYADHPKFSDEDNAIAYFLRILNRGYNNEKEFLQLYEHFRNATVKLGNIYYVHFYHSDNNKNYGRLAAYCFLMGYSLGDNYVTDKLKELEAYYNQNDINLWHDQAKRLIFCLPEN